MDTADKVLGRATEYILVNLVITEIARYVILRSLRKAVKNKFQAR